MSVYSGQYRTVVQFQTVDNTPDALGEPARTATNAIQTGCAVRQASANEQARGGIGFPEDGVIVDARYSPSFDNINNESLMIIKGRTYEITSIDDRMFDNRTIRFIGRPVR